MSYQLMRPTSLRATSENPTAKQHAHANRSTTQPLVSSLVLSTFTIHVHVLCVRMSCVMIIPSGTYCLRQYNKISAYVLRLTTFVYNYCS